MLAPAPAHLRARSRAAPEGDATARYLFVVSREAPELYGELRERFADDPKVTVILDRRVGERRRRSVPVPVERRHRDRRGRPEVEEELRTSQYAIVTLP